MSWSLGSHLIADEVLALVDKSAELGTSQPNRVLTRVQAQHAILAVLWAYGCESGSTAGAYAWMNLMDALGLKDWSFNDSTADMTNASQVQP